MIRHTQLLFFLTMLKHISKLTGATSLKKDQQRNINGGVSEFVCYSPQFNSGGPCPVGTTPHPDFGHCICCAN